MEIRYISEQNVTVMIPDTSRLDAGAALPFKETLLKEIESGHLRILINMEKVGFIDSSGLGAIISGLRRVGLKGDIKLCHGAEQVASLLKLTRLDQVLPMYADETAALATF